MPKKKDDPGLEITLTLDDKPYLFRYNELTAVDVKDCRRETGFTLNHLLGFVQGADVDIDTFAAMIWLARRQAGERALRYDAVAAQITPNSNLQVDVKVPESEGSDDPE